MEDDNKSLFEDQLQRALAVPPAPDVQAFWARWQAKGGTPISSLSSFRAACADGGARALLRRLLQVARETGVVDHHSVLANLLPSLVLAAAEHELRQRDARGEWGDDGCLRIKVRDVLAAAMLAAAEFNTGLRIAWDAQTGQRIAGNVIPAAAMGELGWRSTEAMHHAALLAAAEGGLGSQGLSTLMRRVDAYRVSGVPEAEEVRFALEQLEADEGVRLMFALPVGSNLPLASDAALREKLRLQHRVHTWFQDPPAADAPEDDPWLRLQGSLLQWIHGVFDTVRPLRREPEPVPVSVPALPARPQVFISYAHADNGGAQSDDDVAWCDRLKAQLHVHQEDGLFEVWVDHQGILPGDTWRQEIAEALARCQVAVLLVSANLLASEFIQKHEIPTLLRRRQRGDLLVLPLLIKQCDWPGVSWLEALQFVGEGQPLQRMRPADQNQALALLTQRVREHAASLRLTPPAP